ncbi:MAG: histidine kinase [Acidobacteriota bacterium]
MHPILRDRRWILPHLIAWLVAGQMIGLFVRSLLDAPWAASMLFAFPIGLVGGIMALSAWDVSQSTSIGWTSRVQPIATFLLAAIINGSIWAYGGRLWWQAIEHFGLADLTDAQHSILFATLQAIGIGGYLLAVAAYRVAQAFGETEAATRRALQSEVAQREAELRALRAQLDPHFLFNSLNSISGLTSTNPEKAREMCQLLADFLRQGLSLAHAPRITLRREIELAEQYLRIEQVRFGARLGVAVHVDPDTVEVLVPPLLLQPLVENAVRHGIATMIEGGTIGVETRRAGDRIVVTVSNPRDPDAHRRGTGLGLDIVRRRLAATFGDRAALTVEPLAEAFRAQLTVPVEEA